MLMDGHGVIDIHILFSFTSLMGDRFIQNLHHLIIKCNDYLPKMQQLALGF